MVYINYIISFFGSIVQWFFNVEFLNLGFSLGSFIVACMVFDIVIVNLIPFATRGLSSSVRSFKNK